MAKGLCSGTTQHSFIQMVTSCCAVGCLNQFAKGSNIKFYRFPTDPITRTKWIAAVDRKDWVPTVSSWICSEHFVTGSKSNDPLSPAFVPSIFLHIKSPAKRKASKDLKRYKRRKVILKKKRERMATAIPSTGIPQASEPVIQPSTPPAAEYDDNSDPSDPITPEDPQQLENKYLKSEVESLKLEVNHLREEIMVLRTNNVTFCESSFKGNDAKVRFYTGLTSFGSLMAIFSHVESHVTEGPRSMLSKFEQFMMVLLKLRLNLMDQDIAYHFGVHQTTVSRNFKKWMDVL